MKSRINREAREISISELWWYVISKWKWLVIGMVVGALVLGAYGAYSAYRANESAKTNANKEYTMEDLTPEEQEEVKELIKEYEHYQNEVERLENNYLMNLDYNNATHCLVTYYVDTDYSYSYTEVKENYASTLVSMYKTYAHSNEVHEKLLELNIDGIEEIDLPYIYSASNEGNIIKIGGYSDLVDSELLMDTICVELEKYYMQMVGLIGEHELVKISEDIRTEYSESIRIRQTMLNGNVDELRVQLENDRNALGDIQKKVYDKEIERIEGVNEESIQSNQENQLTKSIKYIVLGIVGGLVVFFVFVVGMFLLDNKIKSVREFRQIYGIDLLGTVLRNDVSNKDVIKKLNGIRLDPDEAKQKQYVLRRIISKCEQENIEDIIICSTISNVKEYIGDVIKEINNAGIKCGCVEKIDSNVESLSEVLECKNVILVEQLNKTKERDFETEIELCDKLPINIVGAIVII